MDLNLVRVFVAVYELKSLTAASERLFVTQSAVSQSLAKLRVALQDELFIRRGGAMAATSFADTVYPQLRDALTAVERVTSRIEPFDPGTTTKTFRIALSELGEVGWLANIVFEVRKLAPQAHLEVVRLETEQVAQQLRQGEVDIAIAPIGIPGDLERTLVKTQGYGLIMSVEHPLASGEITTELLLKVPRVAVPSDSGSDQMESIQRGSAAYREPAVIAQHFASIPPILRAQPDLVAIVPESIGAGWAKTWPLVVRPLPFEMASLELSVYRRSTTHDQEIVDWLSQVVQRAIVALPEHFETITGGN